MNLFGIITASEELQAAIGSQCSADFFEVIESCTENY
jgi:hypothetical protein